VSDQLFLPFDNLAEKKMNPFFNPTSGESEIINTLHQSLQSEFALIRMTFTMLDKYTIDASDSIRFILSESRIVDFSQIDQGEKIFGDAIVLTEEGYKESKVSYYRPKAKNGDPRFYIYGFKKLVEENTLVFFTIKDSKLVAIPVMPAISRKAQSFEQKKYAERLEDDVTQFAGEPISNFETLRQSVSEIKTRGWIKSIQPNRLSPKDVGLTLEHELGISANVDRGADFLGEIEIKSSLQKSNYSLWSQVPNWRLSALKSIRDIILKYGYVSSKHPGFIDLYVTVSNNPNNQGLFLETDFFKGHLLQNYITDELKNGVCLWEFTELKKRLWRKHPKTLWVDAEMKEKDGVHYFRYIKATYSEKPVFSQFLNLISQGIITLDWREKVKPDGSGINGHGPAFRMNSSRKGLLFSSEKEVLLN